MATYYVKSGAGGAGTGADWTNAFTTLAAADAVDAAGDTIYVADSHSESTAAAVTLTWAGTVAAPTRILCVVEATPPVTMSTGAIVATTGASTITMTSASLGAFYCEGITFKSGSSTNVSHIYIAAANDSVATYKNCVFELTNTSGTSEISHFAPSNAVLENCEFKFASTAQDLVFGATTTILGGSITGSQITTLFAGAASRGGTLDVKGMDLSNGASTMNLVSSSLGGIKVKFINCKMPASWSGAVHSGTPSNAQVCEYFNCDDGDTNDVYQRKTQLGTINSENTIVRTGGANNGIRGLSWKMDTNADAEWSHSTLSSPEIVRWNSTVGSSITVAAHIVHDTNVAAGQGSGTASAFRDDEVWIEVMYLGTSGFPIGTIVSDAASSFLATPADQATSTETWTTTGMTTPVKQQLSVTFTPNEVGYIHATVKMAKASKTIYVCPKLSVN
jgi:hypothetical protein